MPVPSRRTLPLLACTATAAVAVAAPAQASDAGLRRVVTAQEQALTPTATAFRQADAALTSGSDTDGAAAAAGAFRAGLHRYKVAVVPVHTTGAAAATAKKRLLSAIREYDIGLVVYLRLLDQVKAGASRDALRTTFVKLNKRFEEARVDETAGLKLLKIRLKTG